MNKLFFVLILSTMQSYAYQVQDLTLDEKIGQLLMVAAVSNPTRNEAMIAFVKDKDQPYTLDPKYIESLIKSHHIGGVIFLGEAFGPTHAKGTAHEQVAVTKRFQAASGKIPLLIGLDAEWGLGMFLENDVMSFPQAMTLGALCPSDEYLIRFVGREIGEHCKSIGVHINFAPVADVNTNPNNPVTGCRSFGDDAQAVARKAALYMQGLRDSGLLSCAKHFPGHGDTSDDSHKKLPRSDHDVWRLHNVELAPFKYLIALGVSAIMTAHMIVPALDNEMATVSHTIVTDLLRRKLGFTGLIFTDGLGMKAVTNLYISGDVAMKALKAGVDVLLCPVDVPGTVAAIKQAVADGIISEGEINEKVARVLHAKQQKCLQEKLYNSRGYGLELSNDSRLIAWQAYEAAMTRIGGDAIVAPDSHCAVIVSRNYRTNNPFIAELSEKCSCDVYVLEELTEIQLQKINNTDFVIAAAYLPIRFISGSYQELEPYRILERIDRKIMVLFGSPYYLQHLNYDGQWIIGYEHAHEAQVGAARVAIGQLEPRGVLPIKVAELNEEALKIRTAPVCL